MRKAAVIQFEYPIQYNKDWNSSDSTASPTRWQVWIPNPIQQGLKRGWAGPALHQVGVWIPNPIQQGLKPYLQIIALVGTQRLNTQSNTTRIETRTHGSGSSPRRGFEYPIQYNKDWNLPASAMTSSGLQVWIPNPIQQGLKQYY